MRVNWRALCLPLFAVFLTACEDMEINIGGSDRYREDFHYSYALAPGGSLRLDSFNGSVEISGWDKNTIDIDGTKYASTSYRLKEIKIDIQPTANSVSVHVDPPLDRHGNAGARFTIHVPKNIELSSISTSNGKITVESIDGPTHLHTSNGSVRVNQVVGAVEVKTSNGSIEVADITGDTTLHSSNGSIRAEVRKGRFGASTTNSSITARLMEPDPSPVRLESSNGHIELTMDAVREVKASTSNSSITVRLPASANAQVDAHTTNSSISCDFDVSVHGGMISKHRLEGIIGTGGPLLDLGTSNGSIKLLRM